MKRSNFHRRTIRLPHYNYSEAGAYFVTFNTHNYQNILGHIRAGKMHHSPYGGIVLKCWNDLPRHYPHLIIDAFTIMPNHVHAILVLDCEPKQARHSLTEIVRALKSYSARNINLLRRAPGQPVWHRSFYERIIRSEAEWNRIRKYITENLARWEDKITPGSRGE
jgi:putative transposase